jgi:hypothetical protein
MVLDDLKRAEGTWVDEGACERLAQRMQSGIALTTSYSGIDAPGLSLHFLERALVERGLLHEDATPAVHNMQAGYIASYQIILDSLSP